MLPDCLVNNQTKRPVSSKDFYQIPQAMITAFPGLTYRLTVFVDCTFARRLNRLFTKTTYYWPTVANKLQKYQKQFTFYILNTSLFLLYLVVLKYKVQFFLPIFCRFFLVIAVAATVLLKISTCVYEVQNIETKMFIHYSDYFSPYFIRLYSYCSTFPHVHMF